MMEKDPEKGKYMSPEGSRTWEYLSAVFCAFGSFCAGQILGWNSPSLAELTVPNSRILMTPEDASTLAACVSVGYALAFLLSIFIVDRIGRRGCILVGAVPMMVSWGMIVAAENAMVLIGARSIAGFSIGLIFCSYPTYMAESVSANIRGSLTAISTIMFHSGIFFMFGVAPHLGLRVTACCCMGFTMIFLICFWCVPESPYFLVMVGRLEEAEAALEKLRGKTDVTDELELIKSTLREKGKSLIETGQTEKITPARQSAFRQLFTIRGNLKSFVLGMLLITAQHSCGSEIILYYCHVILGDMSSQVDVYTASLIFGVLQIFAATLTFLTVDRFGRRPVLFTSGLAATVLLSIIATYFYLMETTDIDVKRYSMIPLCSIFLLVMVLTIGVVNMPDTIQPEIYAIDVKMLANSIVGISGSVMTMLTTKSYFVVVKSWGFGHSVPFYTFAFFTFLCTALLMRWLPETKGKTLLEIQKELNA